MCTHVSAWLYVPAHVCTHIYTHLYTCTQCRMVCTCGCMHTWSCFVSILGHVETPCVLCPLAARHLPAQWEVWTGLQPQVPSVPAVPVVRAGEAGGRRSQPGWSQALWDIGLCSGETLGVLLQNLRHPEVMGCLGLVVWLTW